jgi:hypothetical protein
MKTLNEMTAVELIDSLPKDIRLKILDLLTLTFRLLPDGNAEAAAPTVAVRFPAKPMQTPSPKSSNGRIAPPPRPYTKRANYWRAKGGGK